MNRPPAFLLNNEPLWEAWNELQAAGAVARIDGDGWRVVVEQRGDVLTQRLELDYRHVGGGLRVVQGAPRAGVRSQPIPASAPETCEADECDAPATQALRCHFLGGRTVVAFYCDAHAAVVRELAL